MQTAPLGHTGITLTRLGYGAFKIGRNQGIKYPENYQLPDDAQVERLLNSVLDLGITYFDTAPAYGQSEAQIGRCLSHRRHQFTLSTKVGETFLNHQSHYDFSPTALERSLTQSLTSLRTDHVDIVYLHCNDDDLQLATNPQVIETMHKFKARGWTRAIGFSGKKPHAAQLALNWADVLMVTYHRDDTTHARVMQQAQQQGVGIVVKKGLASGHLDPASAIGFVLAHSAVSSLLVASLNIEHIRSNISAALITL